MKAWCIGTACAAALAAAGWAWAADASRVPKPAVTIEKPGQCVAPTEQMRREHMNLLKHDRDRTVHQGVRKVQASLQACIDCHASSKTGSVLGAAGFCQSCHDYAGVSPDCFQCHAHKPKSKTAAAPAAQPTGGPAAGPAAEVKQ